MDIWEANSVSTAFTPHSADTVGQTRCTGEACGGTYSTDRYGGTTDPDGCDFNSYRMGNTTFYGPGKTVDTSKVFTVVTQFITADGTATGTLSEIKRFYVQNGVTIANSASNVAGVTGNSLTAATCAAQKTAFGDKDVFATHGGFTSMSKAFGSGMVLVLSLWDDYAANMLWLDSTYPVTGDVATPGVARGTCATTSGVPSAVEAASGSSKVIYSNIKVGPLGSTFNAGSSTGTSSSVVASSSTATKSTSTLSTSTVTKATTSSVKVSTTAVATTVSTSVIKTSTTTSAAASGSTAAHWAQCGGNSWTGPTVCATGYTCTVNNEWYSQCL